MCWYISRNRIRQEIHIKRVNDKMFKQNITILANFFLCRLKIFDDLVWNKFLYKQTIIVNNETKTCLS